MLEGHSDSMTARMESTSLLSSSVRSTPLASPDAALRSSTRRESLAEVISSAAFLLEARSARTGLRRHRRGANRTAADEQRRDERGGGARRAAADATACMRR